MNIAFVHSSHIPSGSQKFFVTFVSNTCLGDIHLAVAEKLDDRKTSLLMRVRPWFLLAVIAKVAFHRKLLPFHVEWKNVFTWHQWNVGDKKSIAFVLLLIHTVSALIDVLITRKLIHHVATHNLYGIIGGCDDGSWKRWSALKVPGSTPLAAASCAACCPQ